MPTNQEIKAAVSSVLGIDKKYLRTKKNKNSVNVDISSEWFQLKDSGSIQCPSWLGYDHKQNIETFKNQAVKIGEILKTRVEYYTNIANFNVF